MAGYETGTANDPEEGEEEENTEGDHKQPATNPIREVANGKKKARRGHDRKGQGT